MLGGPLIDAELAEKLGKRVLMRAKAVSGRVATLRALARDKRREIERILQSSDEQRTQVDKNDVWLRDKIRDEHEKPYPCIPELAPAPPTTPALVSTTTLALLPPPAAPAAPESPAPEPPPKDALVLPHSVRRRLGVRMCQLIEEMHARDPVRAVVDPGDDGWVGRMVERVVYNLEECAFTRLARIEELDWDLTLQKADAGRLRAEKLVWNRMGAWPEAACKAVQIAQSAAIVAHDQETVEGLKGELWELQREHDRLLDAKVVVFPLLCPPCLTRHRRSLGEI